jgi:hypothetical protein
MTTYLVRLWKFDHHQYRERTVYIGYTPPDPDSKQESVINNKTEMLKGWLKSWLYLIKQSLISKKENGNVFKTSSPEAQLTKKKQVKAKSATTLQPAKGKAAIIVDFSKKVKI